MSEEFFTDVTTLRKRARQHIERGAVTKGYKGQLDVVLRLLNEALATEIVCVLRYRRHHFMATGIHAQAVAAEFLEHAGEEQGHADQIAARIVQLGGEPDFSPQGLHARSHSEYVAGENLMDMIREDLVAERDRDRQLLRDDPLHRRLRLHDAHHARGNPGHGGRARRRPGEPARDARPEGSGPGGRGDSRSAREGLLLSQRT